MSMSNIAIMESLAAELKVNPTPRQEYCMVGSIVDTKTELLLHRLQAICDYGRPAKTFRDHEIVFSMPKTLPPEMQITMHIRKALNRRNTKLHLRYVGQPEISDSPTSVRTRIDFMTNKMAVEFLATLGFELEYDFIAQGYMFRKGFMKITLSKIYKTSNRFIDEILWCGGNHTPNMKQFAEDLMPLVKMHKYEEMSQQYLRMM